MPLIDKKSWLAAKIETTPGTAISLAAADATFRCYNATLRDQTGYVPLAAQGGYSKRKGSHGARMGECTFDLDLRPKSGAHPAWLSTFMPACAGVAATNVYTPRCEFPGANVKTLTIAKYTHGIYEQLHGCMGNMVFRYVHGEPVMISCRFIGCYTKTTDVALISPTLGDTLSPIRNVSSGLVIGSYTPRTDSWEVDLGNDLVMLAKDQTPTGYSHAFVQDRRPTLRISPESELVATQPWWADFEDHTERAGSAAHQQASLGFAWAWPAMELIEAPQPGERGGLRTDELLFALNGSAEAADDDWSLTVDIAG